jgi:hypothetical protein
VDTKAPETVNGMEVIPFDQRLAEVRERYLSGISDILDEALSCFVLPADRVALLHDAAFFCCFMAALKCAEVKTPAGETIDGKSGVREWWPIKKKLHDEVAPALIEWGIEARQAQLKGTGDAAAEG